MTRRRTITALEALIDAGYLSHQRAADVLAYSTSSGRTVARVLRELGLAEGLTDVRIPPGLDHPFVDLVEFEIDPQALASVPEQLARRHSVMPIAFEGERLVLAVSDPTDVIAIDDVRTVSGREVRLVLAEDVAIQEAWIRASTFDGAAESLSAASSPDDDDEEADFEAIEDAPIVRAINQIIAQAAQQRASDLHIEPQEHDVVIRFRLDGVLHEVMRIPKSLHSGVVSRIKVMAEMNIAERRIPQDGRITVSVEGRKIDLRIATVPSVWGEEVILRILDRSGGVLSLEELGFLSDTLGTYEGAFRKPHGAILVVGPTGSGKSTTLYSTLSVVKDVTKKIITVEDPVEFRLGGLSQIHVNPKAGLTFATALRSILRSDPDIIMVGEIRDTETARIAIESAMTGHLVFSTLHTNDAPSAVTRLIEMGVEPFLVASAVECVLAQRLARKLCERCRGEYTPHPDVAKEVGVPNGEEPLFYRPVGCNQCAHTGYRGRVALVELMVVTEEIERLAVERRSSDEVRKLAIEQGMRTLREDGYMKVRSGTTSLEEVLRIVDGRQEDPIAEPEPEQKIVPMRRRKQKVV